MHARQRLIALSALPLVAALGCTKKDPEPAASDSEATKAQAPDGADTAESAGNEPAAAGGDKPVGLGTEALGLIQAATAAAEGAPLLEHENILGHFMVGNAVASVKEIKTQAAPASVANMVDLEVAKSMAAMQLGERSSVALNVDLEKPFGCALVDTTVHDVPVACVLGYKGGAEELVKDLGTEGRKDDAKGHTAAFEIEGETVYIDALGDEVVLANHPELLDKAKSYLETNIVGRADKAIADFEVVMYPADAAVRYAKEVEDLTKAFDELSKAGAGSPGDLRKRVAELDQVAFGFGLTPDGAHFSAAAHAKSGSELQTDFDTAYAGRMDPAFVSKMPATTFAFMGAESGSGITNTDNWKKGVDMIAESMADELGVDAAKFRAELEAFVDEEAELYSRDLVAGLVFEPGTLGATILEVGKTAPGRDKWKAWTERFTAEAVLPPKGKEAVTWSFEAGATTIDGVEIDRWVIKPTAEALREAATDPDFEVIRKKWPELELTIDRAELDDRVIFVASPTGSDAYMTSAIAAARGTKTMADHAGWSELGTDRSGLTALYAVDVAAGVEWVRALIPADKAAEIPSPLGVDLRDVTMVLRHPAPGVVAGSFTISQPFIDQLRRAADRK